MKKQSTVALPALMKHLPKDNRGYPITYVTHVDENGAHFAITNQERRQDVIMKKLCGICGKPLHRYRYLVGGATSAYHPHGAYLDPPMHKYCAEYALKVCPFLAMPSYTKHIDEKLSERVDKKKTAVSLDQGTATKPGIFVLIAYKEDKIIWDGFTIRYVKPTKPYIKVSYWKDGIEIDDKTGLQLAKEELHETFEQELNERKEK